MFGMWEDTEESRENSICHRDKKQIHTDNTGLNQVAGAVREKYILINCFSPLCLAR